MLNRLAAPISVALVLIAAPIAAQVEIGTRATVLQAAPIMLFPDASREPLRVAAQGTSLVVLGAEGMWYQVQFEDPQFGRRVGYIESRYVRVSPPAMKPLDLSVPGGSAGGPAAAVTSQQGVPSGQNQRLPSPSTALEGTHRRGFWFNVGGGFGSAGVWCDGCGGSGRESAFSGGLSLGATLPDGVSQIGVGTTGWARSYEGELANFGTLDFRYRTYFTPQSNFSMQVGVGLGSASFFGFDEYGLGWMAGGGYDVRVGRNVSLTPFGNVFAVHLDGGTLNNIQFGLGVTIH